MIDMQNRRRFGMEKDIVNFYLKEEIVAQKLCLMLFNGSLRKAPGTGNNFT